MARSYSLLDEVIAQFDHGLRTLSRRYEGTGQPSPASAMDDTLIEPAERAQAGRMMRVNHAGEVMAQALYHGQAFMTRDPALRTHLEQAAREEADHLIWCQERLRELQTNTSLLNPLWYGAGWTMGMLAAKRGKGVNLGLVVEVENQVDAHLERHLQEVPLDDAKTRSVLEKMRDDEQAHAQNARDLGATPLPLPVRMGMKVLSRLMTRGSLWI